MEYLQSIRISSKLKNKIEMLNSKYYTDIKNSECIIHVSNNSNEYQKIIKFLNDCKIDYKEYYVSDFMPMNEDIHGKIVEVKFF